MLEQTFHEDFGGELISENQLPANVLALYKACRKNSSCEVLEVRQDETAITQSIVAEFCDGTFDAGNEIGIQRTERLALVYDENASFPWQVRALRTDFPHTTEQNHVREGEPRSLCLYLATWRSVERSWTPQLFLKQIFWWLRATADGTIHSKDQPLERLFYSSPDSVLLPRGYTADFEKNALRNLAFKPVPHARLGTKTLIAFYEEEPGQQDSLCPSLSMMVDPVDYGPIEGSVYTLGQLDDILVRRGSGLLGSMKSAISQSVPQSGVEAKNVGVTLLILAIPRTLNGEDHGLELQGFFAGIEFAELGKKLGLLDRIPDQSTYYLLPGEIDNDWKKVALEPANVSDYPSRRIVHRYSGLPADEDGPEGIIAGVGALGGLLAKIWNTECWGDWHYADADIVQAHNIVRHIATHHVVGSSKALVVSHLVNTIHPCDVDPTERAIEANIESENEAVCEAIENSSLLVDVTTTTHVPRIVARGDRFPRTVSVFLTPSGSSAVMMYEDSDRSIRCDSLEAQYYRAVLESDWGETHLGGHRGTLWVGGGCREITLPLSNEVLHLHSGNLARQIRKHYKSDMAKICIWEYEEDLGSTTLYEVPAYKPTKIEISEWSISIDQGLLADVLALRESKLPAETGGIILGIVDQRDKTITLVKMCDAPPQSESTESEFKRAAYESAEFMEDCFKRTAGIVTYVGEWHSHVGGVAPLPSASDIWQHNVVNHSLLQEGRPGLMAIISENSIGLYLPGEGKVIPIENFDIEPLKKTG